MRRIAIALLLAACACHSAPTAAPATTLQPGRVEPGSVEALVKSLRSFRGKPVVVNYWATWCIPCRSEMSRIVAAASQYGSAVHFLGVDVEDDTKAADAFARERGVNYPLLSDPHGAIRSAQRLVGLPATQFYRADGALAFVNNGEIQSADLKHRIQDLLIAGKPAAG
jgi:cytochrome c biogenesis protein CcmG/thiol:disulfide interchange protein DsbE